MSWLFSQVLVAEYLGENFLDGEQSVLLSVMPTQHKFWRKDKMMEASTLSQFGLTLQVLTESRGQELLTWYLEAFHAKTLAQQEKAQELQVKEVDCGQNLHGLLARLDPDTLLWKTAQCSLLEDLELSLQTFPRWGSMQNGACYLQPILAQTTRESASGYLPNNETFFHTPTTGTSGGSNSRKALAKRILKYPTPTPPSGGGCGRFRRISQCNQAWHTYTSFNKPEPIRMVDGVANRMDRLRAVGNGQVPLCAATAFTLLRERLEK